jgi:hypothetical protein
MPKPVDSNSAPRNVEFLKDLAEEDNQDILKLARKNGLKDDKLVDLMLTQLAGIAGAAYQKDPNTWLSEVAKFYNARLPETGDLLNEDDVRGLKWITDRYAKRLMSEG